MDEKTLEMFKESIQNTVKELRLHADIAVALECSEPTISYFFEFASAISSLENFEVVETNVKINYVNQFSSIIHEALNILPLRGYANADFVKHQNLSWLHQYKILFESLKERLSYFHKNLTFSLTFFEKIGYFSNNVVAIGANGSGKTSLSNKFKSYLSHNGIVISAQRILLVPSFESISNPATSANELRQAQTRDKSSRDSREYGYLQQEFGLVLKNLLAENTAYGNEYRRQAIQDSKQGKSISIPLPTKLDKTLEIWNSLITHRTLICTDGMNISVQDSTGLEYSAIQMSDGEKVMLYLIAQVLQAPSEGFVVADEPEMYLHKTVLKKLWDILERERKDCLFIYLTHDLEFAVSRSAAKKIWIKSFNYPEDWDIANIPDNDIPEELLLELLGSRKNILFCEGDKGSIDERIYSLLFPSFTVTPVGSCFDVINHTKAFNKISNININAFGLIDADHHGRERLISLSRHKIYSFDVAEAENLFLDESFLVYMCEKTVAEPDSINKLKDKVIDQIDKLKELQASNYVSAKINYYFKDSHVTKGNNLEKLKANYDVFRAKIKIDEWYIERLKVLNEIINNKDYPKAVSFFNHKKGLHKLAAENLGIDDFTDRSFRFLQNFPETYSYLRSYFPEEIIRAGTSVQE